MSSLSASVTSDMLIGPHVHWVEIRDQNGNLDKSFHDASEISHTVALAVIQTCTVASTARYTDA